MPEEIPRGAIKRNFDKEKPIDIEAAVSKVIKDFIDNEKPDANGTVTCDIIALKASILTVWSSHGYLMRISDRHGQKCWAWIDGDYDLTFPEGLTIEDIGGFEDLTPEESGESDE